MEVSITDLWLQAWMGEGVEREEPRFEHISCEKLTRYPSGDVKNVVVVWVLRSEERPGLEAKIWKLVAQN